MYYAIYLISLSILEGLSILTLEDFKTIIEAAFKSERLKPTVIDIPYLVDWQYFFDREKSIDQHLSRLHKLIYTMHCWRFEAIEPHYGFFPHGAKSVYRPYPCTRILEMFKKPKAQCQSMVGIYTGLEPVETYNTWMPEKDGPNSLEGRQGVEGFYILNNIPTTVVKGQTPYIPLSKIAVDYVRDASNSILHHFRFDLGTQESWQKWINIYVPRSYDVNEYQLQILRENPKSYRAIPFAHIILDRDKVANPGFTLGNFTLGSVIDTTFTWPSILAAAMNSVVSSMNMHAQEPRLFVSSNDEDCYRWRLFKDSVEPYFTSLADLNNDDLVSMLRRLVNYNGEIMSSTGSKEVIISKMKNFLHNVGLICCRQILKVNKDFVDSLFSVERDEDVLVKIARRIDVSRGDIKSFQKGSSLSINSVNAILELFRIRDEKLLR